MKIDSFFSKTTIEALKNDPPGEWMPTLPDPCIRLSSGYPEPSLVPYQELKGAVDQLLSVEEDLPLHYLGSPKMDELRGQMVKRLEERGISVSEDELLITAGACQALDLIARVLIDEETVVAVEAPTYMEALEIFKNYTQQFISIDIDQDGIKTDQLEEMLEDRKKRGLTLPRFLYIIPTFQNPTGTSLTDERREHLLELASTYNFLILEDDPYGELHFDKPFTPLKANDREGRVLHVGSLSKVVAPGLRIGWIAAQKEFITASEWFKKDLDHAFAEATAATYLEKIHFNERLKTLRDTYQEKCSVMLQALEQFLPKSTSWYIPEGGYFVWVHVPGLDTADLLDRALSEGVSYVPGKYFYLNEDEGNQYLRLSFSYATKEDIIKGVETLANVITRQYEEKGV